MSAGRSGTSADHIASIAGHTRNDTNLSNPTSLVKINNGISVAWPTNQSNGKAPTDNRWGEMIAGGGSEN